MDFDTLKNRFMEFYKNKKAVALTKLVFYIILIIVAVFSAASMNRVGKDKPKDKTPVVENKDVFESYKELKDYKAIYNFNNKEYTYTFVTKELLKIDNDTYLIEDGKLVNQLDVTSEVPTFDYNFWYLTPSYISNLVELGEENYVTNFANGKTEKSYLVGLNDFVRTFEGKVLDVDDEELLKNKKIEIVFFIEDNKVQETDINLTQFYKLININSLEHVLKIVYE